MPSAPPMAFVLPVVTPGAGGMLAVGVEMSHGPGLTMTFPLEKLADINFRFEFGTNGPDTLKLSCMVDLANGSQFRYGGETLSQAPWCIPFGDHLQGAAGKGHGKGF